MILSMAWLSKYPTAIVVFKSFLLLLIGSSVVLAQEADGIRPLLTSGMNGLRQTLPNDTRLLASAHSIETFLSLVDGMPPDWDEVHGHGGHDERLFALNRKRDQLREGRTKAAGLVTFFWDGELSNYDSRLGGFRVAIGPRMIPTRWGLVRFKPESLPSELVAVASLQTRNALRGRTKIEIIVAMTGRLLPQESIIYDFAHEEPGKGMVMPVVRIERLDYLLPE
jgi:hypothetical protein